MFSAYGYTAGPGFARYCAIVWGILFSLTGIGLLLCLHEKSVIEFTKLPGLMVLAGGLFFLYLGIWQVPREEKEYQLKTEAEKVKYVEKGMRHLQRCFSVQRIILGVGSIAVLIGLFYGLHKTIFP